MELVDDKGLGKIGVGTLLESFQTVADVALGGKHDDGQVGDIDIGTYETEHGEAVHLGHHHVANHQVVVICKQFLQTILTVSAGSEVIVVGQLMSNVGGDFLVVVDHQNMVRGTGLALSRKLDGGRHLGSIVNLFGRQVGIALWQTHGKDGSLHSVGTVGAGNGTVVHIDNHLTKV